jgi:COP9 signalosome complex subunit 7
VQLKSVRALEDLLIECIYSGLLQGRLDQQESHIEVFATVGRDVDPKELPHMSETLSAWHGHVTGLMSKVSSEMGRFKQRADEARKASAELDERVEIVKVAVREKHSAESDFGGGYGDPEARMDFEGDEKMRKSGRLKGRHAGTGGKHAVRM